MARPDYGIDAPGLVRMFFSAGAGALALLIVSLWIPIAIPALKVAAVVVFAVASIYLLGMGSFMIYGSKVMKLRDAERLLDLVPWTGNEQVLDVGCGRGLMLVLAARRLTTGRATGIDIWQQQDQASNSASAALANAALEGVAERVEVKTADMRELPFDEGTFDVVTSNWTIHNLEQEADRVKALDEIVRVLKPGGILIINDIVNRPAYEAHFQQRGMTNIRAHTHGLRDAVLAAITFGSFAPSAVSLRKPG